MRLTMIVVSGLLLIAAAVPTTAIVGAPQAVPGRVTAEDSGGSARGRVAVADFRRGFCESAAQPAH